MAENVPPKTIISAGNKNSALKDPPSKRKAPKIAKTPNNRPFMVPNLNFRNCLST